MSVITLDDLKGSSKTEESASTSGSDDSSDELREAVEAIGGDYESAREYVDENGNKDELVEFAEALAENPDLIALQERYRAMNDQHRIRKNHLYDYDGSFTVWGGEFYGNSDNPAEGTYNWIQQESRNAGGNLFYYKKLFPEPHPEHWPGDDAILWEERPNDDSHVYVTRQFAEDYADFTITVNGEEKPRPPTDEEVDQLSDDSSTTELSIDPREMTVDELEAELHEGWSASAMEDALEVEKANDDRKTAKQALRRHIADAKQAESESDDSEGESHAAVAGRLIAQHDISVNPDAIVGMLDGGMTEEEVVDALA